MAEATDRAESGARGVAGGETVLEAASDVRDAWALVDCDDLDGGAGDVRGEEDLAGSAGVLEDVVGELDRNDLQVREGGVRGSRRRPASTAARRVTGTWVGSSMVMTAACLIGSISR